MKSLTLASIGFGLISLLGLGGCTINTPFKGPKYSGKSGVLSDQDTLVIGLTEVKVGDDNQLNKSFWNYVNQMDKSMAQYEGFIGHSIRKELFGKKGWTMTVWENEASMRAFVMGKLHQEAIKNAWDAVADASFATIKVPKNEIPLSWEKAEDYLKNAKKKY